VLAIIKHIWRAHKLLRYKSTSTIWCFKILVYFISCWHFLTIYNSKKINYLSQKKTGGITPAFVLKKLKRAPIYQQSFAGYSTVRPSLDLAFSPSWSLPLSFLFSTPPPLLLLGPRCLTHTHPGSSPPRWHNRHCRSSA